jgi:hypothetical protein
MLMIGDSISKGLASSSAIAQAAGAPLVEDLRDTWMLHHIEHPEWPESTMGTPTVLTQISGWMAIREWEYVLLEVGAHNTWAAWDDYTTAAQYQTDLGSILSTLIAEVGSSSKIFAMNIPQVDETVSGLTGWNTNLVAYNTALSTVCGAQSPTIPIYDLTTKTDPSTGPYEAYRHADGIHYTAAGYDAMAADLATWLKAQ